jgi:CBS domain containing-hemolysin-like protein
MLPDPQSTEVVPHCSAATAVMPPRLVFEKLITPVTALREIFLNVSLFLLHCEMKLHAQTHSQHTPSKHWV